MYGSGVVDVARLPPEQRIALAKLSGTALRLAHGQHEPGEPDDPVAALRVISTDPVLLGLAAGALRLYWYRADAVQLLRVAGADMQVAGEHAAEIRARLARHGIVSP